MLVANFLVDSQISFHFFRFPEGDTEKKTNISLFFSIIMIYTKTKRKNKSTYNSAPRIFCFVGEK